MKSKIKNQKSKMKYFLAGMMVMLAVSCVAPEDWSDKFDKSIVPGPVSNVQVENVNGGAIISYTLPAEKDLMGAKVTYSLTADGEMMERCASAEYNSIELEGFGDTDERTVTVYAVHKNRNISTGVSKNIQPLPPPIFVIRETLGVIPAFGGIQLTWDNPLRKNMGLDFYVEDSITHEMVLYDKFFSNNINGKIVFKPFKSEEQNFRIEMFDRWQNYAQPFVTTLTPLFEVEIMSRDEQGMPMWSQFDDGRVGGTSTPWRYYYRCDLNDDPNGAANRKFPVVLDWHADNSSYWQCNPNQQDVLNNYIPGTGNVQMPFPLYFTIDMGRKATYSSFKFVNRQTSPPYSNAVMVEFDIWGTNNPKTIEEVECPHGIHEKGSREANQAYWSSWAAANGTDAWKKDWVKLAVCELLLSTGDNEYYNGMTLTEEDLYNFQNGYSFDFNLDVAEPYRYLRWEIHKTNMGARMSQICAMKFWGSYGD